MAYPCCDVTKTLLMRLKINPRWGQFVDLGNNISRSESDTKIL